MSAVLLALLRAYKRVFSPLLPTACRFTPTCSEFAMEAVRRHGAWRGTRLAVGRLLRCRPFSTPGHDPVPENTVPENTLPENTVPENTVPE